MSVEITNTNYFACQRHAMGALKVSDNIFTNLRLWRKFIGKQLYWPSGLKFETDDFDKIALKAIKQSPKWKPAISHNRKIKSYHIQPVTFVQNVEE